MQLHANGPLHVLRFIFEASNGVVCLQPEPRFHACSSSHGQWFNSMPACLLPAQRHVRGHPDFKSSEEQPKLLNKYQICYVHGLQHCLQGDGEVSFCGAIEMSGYCEIK